MRIKVISRGETEFDAEPKHLAPAIREDAAAGRANGDWEVIRQMVADCTEDERGFINHAQYVTVTEDDGAPLWEGWIDGRDEAAPKPEPDKDRPRIVCLCGSTRFYEQFQQANYDLTMRGEIVLSVGFYPHAKAEHGHGEGVGHDSAEKVALDELHKRKIDLADYVLVLSKNGYLGDSTAGEIVYAVKHGKTVLFAEETARDRASDMGLLRGEPRTAR